MMGATCEMKLALASAGVAAAGVATAAAGATAASCAATDLANPAASKQKTSRKARLEKLNLGSIMVYQFLELLNEKEFVAS